MTANEMVSHYNINMLRSLPPGLLSSVYFNI